MTYLTLFLNVLVMITAPLVLARWIAARRNPGWGLFGAGAVTFVLSQVGHIPFNYLILQRWQLIPTDITVTSNLILLALFAGLSAGVFEEGARYLTYRFWMRDARSWGRGLMLGAGHGGIEAIIVGVLLGVNYVFLSRMRGGALLSLVPEGQLPLVKAQIEAVFTAPWHLTLLGALERIFAICFHLSASLMVMQVFVRRQIRWLFAAIGWHTLINGAAVITAVTWGAYASEAVIGAMALISVGIIFWLRAPEPVEPEQEPLPEVGALKLERVDVTAEMLDKSRYM